MPSRLRNVIGTWSGREASQAGQEILLKSMALAVPTYSMSCFLLSKTTCRKMKTPIVKYLGGWGEAYSLAKLGEAYLSKRVGRHGLPRSTEFQHSNAWKTKVGDWWPNRTACVLEYWRGGYYHDGDFLASSRKRHASHTWKAIMSGREVLARGLIKRIGDGSSIDIWRDRWIPKHFEVKTLTPQDAQEVT